MTIYRLSVRLTKLSVTDMRPGCGNWGDGTGDGPQERKPPPLILSVLRIECHMQESLPQKLVLYDGECGLCDRSVQFLLDKDRDKKLNYAPLQGITAAGLKVRHPLLAEIDSIVFVRSTGEEELLFSFSTAVAEICKELPWPWRMIRFIAVFPRPVRDLAYRFVARHRLRVFGGKEACRLPEPGEMERFLR